MILGHINELHNMLELPPIIRASIEKTMSYNPTSLDNGCHIIDDEKLFMNIMSFDTQPRENKRAELHRRYIDIQILLSGIELIDFGTLNSAKNVDSYNKDDDYQLADNIENQQNVVLSAGMFVIFMPNEPHKPGISPHRGANHLKKVVIKLDKSELEI